MSADIENYPGELAMLRGLLGAIRVTAQNGTMPQLQQLLDEHQRDEQAATATPDFFQPERTYQRRRWQFQCLSVAPNPFNGETRAVGYLHRPGEPATATALDPDDWAHGGWADVTEGGDCRG